MKITKWLFLSGFLAALLLAGCFNPVSAPPTGANPASGADTALLEPFTVTLHIDGDGSARAAAGPTESVIGKGGICNFIQLAVVDPATGKVHALTDARQKKAADTSATLTVTALAYEKDYEFLLLMGHWERDYKAETPSGNYRYVEDRLPTLLAAGRQTAHITLGDNTVTITLYPLVEDTKFRSADNSITVDTMKNGVFSLVPGAWDLVWTVVRGNSGTNGFTDLLAAQKETPLFREAAARVSGETGQQPALSVAPDGNVVTLKFGTLPAGNTGAANFNLTYVPFSLNTAGKWNGFTGLNIKDGLPEWIIRNGINDLAQNADTDFTVAAKWGDTKNGNGAAGFMVAGSGGGLPGNGDNTVIDEQNLLDVLGVSTVADAIEELHIRLNNAPDGDGTPRLDGLKLGMYLDLPSLNDGNSTIAWNEEHENLRIVIASFDQYKNTATTQGQAPNTRNHIKFVFKNSPFKKGMRDTKTNDGGYPASNVLKPYLEGGFFNGLKAALGHDYFYEITRPITGGSFGAWTTVDFAAKIFIDAEKEVFGRNLYNTPSEITLTQTALYAATGGAAWQIKTCNGSGNHWWLASPCTTLSKSFNLVRYDGVASYTNADYDVGCAPAFCIR
ncbi:MAG: DUF6273 domain-containing protein [Spirochaetaceae bacterium]|jgi:hypothetical protein|nr:DUF6273 domain-containing protein [Spirochaetaceae bacterium]